MNMSLGHIDNSSLDLLPKIFCLLVLNCRAIHVCVSFHHPKVKGSHRCCQSSAGISRMHLKCYVFSNAKIQNLPVLYRWVLWQFTVYYIRSNWFKYFTNYTVGSMSWAQQASRIQTLHFVLFIFSFIISHSTYLITSREHDLLLIIIKVKLLLIRQAAHGLWCSIGCNMPTHAHFFAGWFFHVK